MSKLTVEFGAMAARLWYQLGIKDPDSIDDLQEDADAITRLAVRGLLSESETHKARTRLMKQLTRVMKNVSTQTTHK